MIYFNEIDSFAAQWLQNLFPDAVVDQRSIVDVKAADTVGFTRCHWFGGIGGWEWALRLAGWPAGRPVWTGSCPCQPFSAAGSQLGELDPRHLWPFFLDRIRECLPATIFGEQVASKLGREWLARVRADLEELGYAVGAADLCAASAGAKAEGWFVRGDRVERERLVCGAPNIRQRLWWVAYRPAFGVGHPESCDGRREFETERARSGWSGSAGSGSIGRLADTEREHDERRGVAGVLRSQTEETGAEIRQQRRGDAAGDCSATGRLANTDSEGRQRQSQRFLGSGDQVDGMGNTGNQGLPRSQSEIVQGPRGRKEGRTTAKPGFSLWTHFDVLPCLDSKARRVESGTFPLAHGLPNRVGRLRGYGNAINPETAAVFIRSFLEATEGVEFR